MVVFFVMIALLIAARHYERLPLKVPPCVFRRTTGIPCVACRGTRAARALSEGNLRAAFLLNPLVVVATAIGVFWIGGFVARSGRPPRRSLSTRWIIAITTLLLLGNWTYLILTRNQDATLMF